MLWRVQCTFKRFSWLVVLPMVLALAACGGSIDGDSVTGSSVVAPSGSDTLSASGKKPSESKVLICHKGRDSWVPPSAVAGHLTHEDFLGSCSAPEVCPCFSAADIQAAASQCSTPATATCGTSDPYFLFLGCNPGGTVPPGVLGVYLTQTADGGFCQRDDVGGSFEKIGLTAAEYQGCVAAIDDSGFCF